jgi:lipopolysaccharide/colanic/teichoic acid biosynthesis glycosyltransferase
MSFIIIKRFIKLFLIAVVWIVLFFVLATIAIYISDKSEKPIMLVAKKSGKYIESTQESLYLRYKKSINSLISYCCLPIKSNNKFETEKFVRGFLAPEQDFYIAYLNMRNLKDFRWWQRLYAFVMSPMFAYVMLPLAIIIFIILILYVILIMRIYFYM